MKVCKTGDTMSTGDSVRKGLGLQGSQISKGIGLEPGKGGGAGQA